MHITAFPHVLLDLMPQVFTKVASAARACLNTITITVGCRPSQKLSTLARLH
jgi:hypothetical protein